MGLRVSLFLVLLVPGLAFAQKREMIELQRDVATLQDQVRNLQRSFDEKMAALTVLVQQSLDSANSANKAVAVLEARLGDQAARQSKTLSEPVAALGAKVDQMSGDFQSVREAVNDVVSRLGRLEQKLTDVNNAVKTIQSPPPAPGPQPGAAGATSSVPTIPADTLYENAYRDRLGGKSDLALQEFADYLKFYPDTEKASSAQFWIGQIHYDQGDYQSALKDFDMVLEKYGDGNKTPEALYMKGQTLVRLERRTDGAKEFRSLIQKYPRHELAAKACSQLKGLGYSCAVPANAKRRKG